MPSPACPKVPMTTLYFRAESWMTFSMAAMQLRGTVASSRMVVGLRRARADRAVRRAAASLRASSASLAVWKNEQRCLLQISATREPIFAAIAGVGAWINLFNLLPIHPLDGGRIARGVAKAFDPILKQLLDERLAAVRKEVREVAPYMAQDTGYVFCAIHNLLAEIPPEKVLALYRTAGYCLPQM